MIIIIYGFNNILNVNILGIPLTLKWATPRNNNNPNSPSSPHQLQQEPVSKKSKQQRLTEAEAQDSASLYIRVPRFNPTTNKSNNKEENDSTDNGDNNNTMKDWLECIRLCAQSSLEEAMNNDSTDDDKVAADTEPALRVKLRVLKDPNDKHPERNFGFLDFASHAAASMAIATLTGHMDGGDIIKKEFLSFTSKDWQMYWAKAKPPSSNHTGTNGNSSMMINGGRTDCWFCLSSPTCEKQLIVSILKDVYVTMPKGPLNDHHALVLPIHHESNGIWNSPSVHEIIQTIQKLAKHAKDVLKYDLFVFKRAIATRGGYHSHIQCIPIPPSVSNQISSKIFLPGIAKEANFSLEQIVIPLSTNSPPGNEKNDNDTSDVSSVIAFLQKELENPHLEENKKETSEDSIDNNSQTSKKAGERKDDGEASGDKETKTTNEEDASVKQILGYFYAQIITNHHNTDELATKNKLSSSSKHFLYKHYDKANFIPLQFGREVVATALNNHELVDWKNCVKSKEEEATIAEQFRKSFAPYTSS